jgi:hypothetical protein
MIFIHALIADAVILEREIRLIPWVTLDAEHHLTANPAGGFVRYWL